MISGHPIFTGFRGLTGCQPDPRDKGVTFSPVNFLRFVKCFSPPNR